MRYACNVDQANILIQILEPWILDLTLIKDWAVCKITKTSVDWCICHYSAVYHDLDWCVVVISIVLRWSCIRSLKWLAKLNAYILGRVYRNRHNVWITYRTRESYTIIVTVTIIQRTLRLQKAWLYICTLVRYQYAWV